MAWTQAEGPGEPPRFAAWPSYATAATLGLAFAVIMTSDALCPEHKLWVDALCSTALVLTVAAVTGLVRGWSSAPFLALGASALGVAIGALDAAHSPVRGGLIVVGFVAAQVLGAYVSFRQVRLLAWDKRLRGDSTFIDEPVSEGTDTDDTAVPTRDEARTN